MKSKTFRKYLFVLLACMSVPMIAVVAILYQIMSNEIIKQTKVTEQKLLSEYCYKYDTSIQSIRRISVELLDVFGNGKKDNFLDKKLDDKLNSLENLSILQDNEIINSYYVYFIEEEKVIKNGSFYDANYFFDKDFFEFGEIKSNAACYAWKPNRSYRDDNNRLNELKIVTHIRSFPLGAIKPQGYIAINVNLDKLVNLFFITDSRIYTIKNMKGELIYSSEDYAFKEENYLTFTTESKIIDWEYSVHIERDALLASIEPIKKLIILIVIFSLFGCICISVITSNLFYQPIRNLMKSIKSDKKNYNENEFELIRNKFIQNEQEKMDVVEKNKKIEPVYYENIMRNLLLYKNSQENITIDNNFFTNSAKLYYVIIFYDYTLKTMQNLGLWAEIKPILKNSINLKVKMVGTQINRNVAAVVAYTDNENEDVNESIVRESRIIQRALSSEKGIEVSVGISKCVNDYKMLTQAYARALGATYYHIYYGTDVIIEEGSVPSENSKNVKYPINIEKAIITALKERKTIKMLSELHLFFTQIEEQFVHPNTAKQWINNLRMAILSSVEILGMELNTLFGTEYKKLYMDIEINNFHRLSDLEEVISGYLKILIENLSENTDDKHKDLVAIIKKYILENINEDLSLASVAEQFKISSPYLSTIFKQQTNQNFVKYLISVKMEFAVDLLVQTKMSISDISEKTGYTNLNSFSNAFKKFYGVTPSQYRYNYTKL